MTRVASQHHKKKIPVYMSDVLQPAQVSSVLEKADEREEALLNFAIAARTLVFWSATLYVLHITYKLQSVAK